MNATFKVGDKVKETSVMGTWIAEVIKVIPITNPKVLKYFPGTNGFAYETLGHWEGKRGKPTLRQLHSNHLKAC